MGFRVLGSDIGERARPRLAKKDMSLHMQRHLEVCSYKLVRGSPLHRVDTFCLPPG